jgi:hypothetical protein
MMRIALIAVMLLAAGAAYAQFNGCGPGFCTGGGGAVTPQPTGKILLVDAASFILQTDAASKICRAGGC